MTRSHVGVSEWLVAPMGWIDRGTVRLRERLQSVPDWRGRDTISAMLLLGAATAAMHLFRSHLNVLNIALIFQILVVIIPIFADRWTSIASAIVAFLLFDLLFISPFYTFNVAATDHVLALFVFLGAATLTSQLIYRVRVRTVEALVRGRQMAILYDLSQALIVDVTVAGILSAVAERVVHVLGAASSAVLMLDDDGRPFTRVAVGALPPLDDRDHLAVVHWVIEHHRPAGLGRRRRKHVVPHGTQGARPPRPALPTRAGSSLYVPIGVTDRVLGVLYVHYADNRTFSEDDQQLLLTFANQIALALERVRLTEEATSAAVLARSDELKSALLSAVSHDLRTPLASIKASATSLLQDGIAWTPEDQRDLLQAIDEETDRLTRLVGNLLDLTRIEAGELKPNIQWNNPEDVVREGVRRTTAVVPQHRLVADIASDLPLVQFDDIEIGQVLFNLIENAGKYAPAGTEIVVGVRQVPDGVEWSVADRGPGIPPGEEWRIFDKFYRIERLRAARGAGMGLAICRGIVEAHGGRIWVEPRNGGGSVFRFVLPLTEPSSRAGEAAAWARVS